MTRLLTQAEIDKMVSRWQAAKGNFDLDFSLMPEDRKKAVQEIVTASRAQWAAEKLKAEHTPENVHKSGNKEAGQSISRIPTTLGHIYFQTVWMNGQLSSSMCFVPSIILENSDEGSSFDGRIP